MKPTARLLDETTNPLHRAMLLNLLAPRAAGGAGRYEELIAEDMMVDEPVYRVTWGVNPGVIRGKEGVLAFYNRSARPSCSIPMIVCRSRIGHPLWQRGSGLAGQPAPAARSGALPVAD
jgi:hypothetical protein